MESGETTLAFANNEMLKSNTGIEPLKGTKIVLKSFFLRMMWKKHLRKPLQIAQLKSENPRQNLRVKLLRMFKILLEL